MKSIQISNWNWVLYFTKKVLIHQPSMISERVPNLWFPRNSHSWGTPWRTNDDVTRWRHTWCRCLAPARPHQAPHAATPGAHLTQHGADGTTGADGADGTTGQLQHLYQLLHQQCSAKQQHHNQQCEGPKHHCCNYLEIKIFQNSTVSSSTIL